MTGEQPKDRLQLLTAEVREFAEQRDWQQFHNAKNLAMALGGEVGELLAELQWVEPSDLASTLEPGCVARARFDDEMADVFIYLTRLADVASVDLVEVARAKLARNRDRYPVGLARGTATKQTRRS